MATDSGYDPKITIVKAAKALAISALSILAAALAAWMIDSTAIQHALEIAGTPAVLSAVLVPVLHFAGEALTNWTKHKDEPTKP